MKALSFASGPMRRAELDRPPAEAVALGVALATALKD